MDEKKTEQAQMPVTVVLFGATGDLSRRKLLPGLLHLFQTGLLPDIQIVGTALEDHTTESFIKFAAESVHEFTGDDDDMAEFDDDREDGSDDDET